MKLNLKDIDAVYKKIEKKLDELLRENDYMSAFDMLDIAINRAPSFPAVPLDKLCEWLGEHHDYYSYFVMDKFAWKKVLTRWMEEQDAVD